MVQQSGLEDFRVPVPCHCRKSTRGARGGVTWLQEACFVYEEFLFSRLFACHKERGCKVSVSVCFRCCFDLPAVTNTLCGFLPRSVRVQLQGHSSGLCSAFGDLHKCQIPRDAAFQLDPHPLPQTFIMQRSHQNPKAPKLPEDAQ